ncbi:hypothetical protein FAM09_11505 [Niastella caeni]|uniref:Uncharacterized protein n=1 Tax=Niastella caeni TaxID=2569763 RepID=A0A4S8HXV5_9BACT|nr:hypothetical protein [Niastella caeni]THU40480.1 hypothetical protein FAM09_11505 [Niastella caeni]
MAKNLIDHQNALLKPITPLLHLILGTALILFSACKSTKVAQAQNGNQSKAISSCDQTIKYYSEKIRMVNSGQEKSFNTEITINPSDKLINISSEPPEQEKVSFNVVIEGIDCHLNSDLTAGQVTYNGYINQQDGSTTQITLMVEAKDGSLTITDPNSKDDGNFLMIVSKWEIIKE